MKQNTGPYRAPLSKRIRPNSEAAPWVVEEVKRLEEENDKLKYQLEYEHSFDAAVDRWAKEDASPWPVLETPAGEEVLNWLINRYENPSESSKSLAKFIPLPHQHVSLTRAQLAGFIPYIKELLDRSYEPK
jgi:hypothetical protein